MRLFRLPRRDKKYTGEETSWQRFFRYIIIALLFCAVIWGFWLNNQRRMEMLKKPAPTRIDKTGSLDGDQERQLAEFVDAFRYTYGVDLILSVSDEPLPATLLTPEQRAGNLLLALSPRYFQVRLEAPPLAAHALGDALTSYLRDFHFIPYFALRSWPGGLQAALNLITHRLDAALAPAHTNNGS